MYRQEIQELTQRIKPCDGLLPEEVHQFIGEMRRVWQATEGNLAVAPVYIMTRASRGPLCKAIDQFVLGKVRTEVTFAQL